MSKIYATGNISLSKEFNVSYYIVEKGDDFLDWLDKLLGVMTMGSRMAKYKEVEGTEENNWAPKIFLKGLGKMIDVHEYYENKVNRIDLFYGLNRVYVTLRGSKEIREKFSKFVKRTREWIKVEEVKKQPDYYYEQSLG